MSLMASPLLSHSSRQWGAAAAAITCAMAAGGADAAVLLTTADGSGADTHISNDGNQAATTNHGTRGSNDLRNYDGVRAKLVYWRFDLSSVTGDLSGATLTLTFTGANRNRTMNVYGLVDEAGDNWGETSITYDSAPGILQPADGGAVYNSGNESIDATKLSLLTTFTTPGSTAAGPVAVITTADVDLDNFLNADTNNLVTFVFYTASSDSAQSFFLASKENTTGATVYPMLNLPNATLVPEPASLALAALGGLAILGRRRG